MRVGPVLFKEIGLGIFLNHPRNGLGAEFRIRF